MEWHLNQKNEVAFEMAYLQTKIFYFDYQSILQKSEKMEYFCGLYLLHLLSHNRTSEYCGELELLDLSFFSNKYISLPIEIEQCISEGNYNKLLSMQNALNESSYLHYLQKLNSSIRFQIARSMEKSFNDISVKDVSEMLLFQTHNDLYQFLENDRPNTKNINWHIFNDRIYFKEISQLDKNVIPSNKVMNDTIKLATEIEKII